MKVLLTGIGCAAVLLLVTVSDGYSFSLNIDEFISNASIRYEKTFTIHAPIGLWNRMLDNPVLVGRLWNLYDFTPQYRVTAKGAGVHILDPTGIEGDLVEIHSDVFTRRFYGSGNMNNWHIPLSLKGKALFLIKQTAGEGHITVTLSIYGEGGDTVVTRLLLKAVSPLLTYYINRRVTRNLADFDKIVDDIVHKPEKIRPMMIGRFLNDFERLLKTNG